MPRSIPARRRATRLEPAPNRKRWTRDECSLLVQNELLVGRYELIDGEVISKMEQKPAHAYVIIKLTAWLIGIFGGDHIRIQLPIDVSDADNETNEPEPDAAVLSRPAEAFLDGNPRPSDVLLAIEVADTTLRFDLRSKAPLYARAGIQDHWVIDLKGRRVFVRRRPGPGDYAEGLEYAEEETLSPTARPDAGIPVAGLLPPQPPVP